MDLGNDNEPIIDVVEEYELKSVVVGLRLTKDPSSVTTSIKIKN